MGSGQSSGLCRTRTALGLPEPSQPCRKRRRKMAYPSWRTGSRWMYERWHCLLGLLEWVKQIFMSCSFKLKKSKVKQSNDLQEYVNWSNWKKFSVFLWSGISFPKLSYLGAKNKRTTTFLGASLWTWVRTLKTLWFRRGCCTTTLLPSTKCLTENYNYNRFKRCPIKTLNGCNQISTADDAQSVKILTFVFV